MSPILSICIPCYGRVEYVRKTLHSIFNDNNDVSFEEYEVIISDNDPTKTIETLMQEFQVPNLKYFNTKCEGFMNSYHVLTYASGEFLKLHNSQTILKKGSLQKMIQEIKSVRDKKPLMFYTNGLLGKLKSISFDSFESFMYSLSYWSSWSNGFCIWKEEFEKIGKVELNKLFPHTSIFLTQYYATSYIINDQILFDVQRIPKRGGHNKFAAFTIEYPSLIDTCYKQRHISFKCKQHIIKNIMFTFLPSLLFNKYIARIETFESTGFKQNIKKYFPSYAYPLVWFLVITVPFKLIYGKIKISL